MDNKANNVIILAGGESVKEYDLSNLSKRGIVIGVNQAFVDYPECDIGITMDRLWIEAWIDFILHKEKPFFVRECVVKNLSNKISENIRLFPCKNIHEMAFEGEQINGTSSGMCALNLALKMKPDNIYLLGFDMGGGYWHRVHKWNDGQKKQGKYKEWVKQFFEISTKTKQKIFNVNHKSALTCFPVLSYTEFCNVSR